MTTQKIKIGDTWFPVNEVIATAGGGGVTAHGLLSGLDGDDHTQYLTNARGDARYDPIGDAASGDLAHVIASDPHPEYLTPAEGDAAYDAAGTAAAGDTSHVGAADPHTVYLRKIGGTLTGPLLIDNPPGGSFFRMIDSGAREVMVRPSGNEGAFAVFDSDWLTLKNIRCADPTADVHAATKGYVDRMQFGRVNVASAGGLVVTFPNPYAAAPAVFVQAELDSANSGSIHAYIDPVTATQCVIRVRLADGTAIGGYNVSWQAIGDLA